MDLLVASLAHPNALGGGEKWQVLGHQLWSLSPGLVEEESHHQAQASSVPPPQSSFVVFLTPPKKSTIA